MSHFDLTGVPQLLRQSSVEAIKRQFNRGVDQVKSQLSSTSEDMVRVPKMDGSGVYIYTTIVLRI
jgi:hypothetical protein